MVLPDGLRVAAMDRRGRGRSGRGSDDGYRLDVETGDLISVAEALGGGVVVAAHSFGATITLQALRLGSDLITGAVLYEPPLPSMPAGLGSSEAMLAALADGRHEDALVAFVRDMVKLAPDEIDAYRVSQAWAVGVDLIWTMRREGPALTGLDADITQYSCIDQPIQLLVGPRTAPHRRRAVSALAGVLPNAETTVLEGQGHGALTQAPGLVARAITDFLLRVG